MKTFEPVSTHVVAVALGPGRERGRIGAAAGLGERVAAERVAACERRQQCSCFCASVPHFATVLPKSPFETETIPRTDESALPSSSQSRQYETESSPPPPSSSGRPAARKPASASVPTSARGSSSASSQSRACGTSSRSQSSRADARISSCSGVSVKSMKGVGAVSGPHDPFIQTAWSSRAAARRRAGLADAQEPLLYRIRRWCEMMKWSVADVFSFEP